jgi:hypothetical protein
MMRSGDSLGISHYTVDGIEIRDIFWPVYRMYFDYFETRSPASLEPNDGGKTGP